MATEPVPFAIIREPNGLAVASNGPTRVAVLDADGSVFLRRGVRHLTGKPVAEQVLPLVNELAGQLLQNPAMPKEEVVARLSAVGAAIPPDEPRNIEWVVAELGGVRVYFDGSNVVVTRQDLLI